jgi:hypothetical protein
MSISNPVSSTSTTNPVTLYLEWSGKNGFWKMYDKETQQRTELKGDIKFAVLDTKNGVAGYIEGKGTVRSNEVDRIDKEELTVTSYKDGESSLFERGMYADIKDGLKAKGIKFRKIVYALILEANEDIVGCVARLDLGGAAMTSWIQNSIPDGAGISVGDPELKKTPIMEYYSPVFAKFVLSEDEAEEATTADRSLQIYFGGFDKEEESSDDVPF